MNDMNAKKAKALRSVIAKLPGLQPSCEDLLTPNDHTGEMRWDQSCYRGVYRMMKKKYHRKEFQMISRGQKSC